MPDILHKSIYKDDTGELFLEINPELGPIIHMYSYKWSKEVYKHYGQVWTALLQRLADEGHTYLHAAILLDDRRLCHFAKLFGFEDTGEEITDNTGNIRRLMKCAW